MNRNAISLFSSSGIGDLGLRENGIDTVIACELLSERMELFKKNYPQAQCFCGDIWKLKNEIINSYQCRFSEPPFLILATPPCQGMSSNGMGKMLSDYRKGLRPKMDERNRLIIPAVSVIKTLRPLWVIFENVANMENTMILDENDELIKILDYIAKQLQDEYAIFHKVIDCADYGVPQHRRRLITVLTRTQEGKEYLVQHKSLLPEPTHSENSTLVTNKWITVRKAIGSFPPLRAEQGKNADCKFNPLHRVPLLDEKKRFWIDNTPEGETAFNNQCINPKCLFKGNAVHGAKHNKEGINQAKTSTPLYCEKCGSLLPRPYVEDACGVKRIMKGFTSAYKRMSWDEPASTLTQNFQFACSDNKVHPNQCRVLSLYEGIVLQTIAMYEYSFAKNGVIVSDGLIRDTIGESVPPLVIDKITKLICSISAKRIFDSNRGHEVIKCVAL